MWQLPIHWTPAAGTILWFYFLAHLQFRGKEAQCNIQISVNSVLPVASKGKNPVQGNCANTGSFPGNAECTDLHSFRNYFPSISTEKPSPVHGPLSWIIMKFEATLSRSHLEGLSIPYILEVILFISTVTRNVQRQMSHRDLKCGNIRKHQVAASAHVILCEQTYYSCVPFFVLKSIKWTQN